MQQKSLYERLGGSMVLGKALIKLEEKIQANSILAPVFKDVDFKKMHEHRKQYLTNLFGGEIEYTGKSLKESHQAYNLNEAHFNLFVLQFRSSLEELNISKDLIQEAVLALEGTKDEVLNKQSLFERIGGEATLSKFEELFKTRILNDSELGPIYGKVDPNKISHLYHQYITLLFGRKVQYEGRNIREVHAAHNIDDNHFDHFLKLFRECFLELKVKEDLIQEAIANLEKVRSEVVTKASVFDRIGGYEILNKALVKLNEKLLADPTMAPFFANSDTTKLTEQRKNYMAAVFGGPQSYSGKSMQEAHHSSHISDGHFNLFTYHLKAAFAEMNISQNLIDEAVLILESDRDAVLNRKSLFERIGGDNTLSKFEDMFTKKFLNDPVLGPVYGTTDPVKIKGLYHQFMKLLFGGKTHYGGRPIREAHAGHHINGSQFNRFINLFRECFSELNVKEDLIQEAISNLEKFRSEIVDKPSLFDRIGGYEVLHKILVRFTEKVLADQSMRPFFTNSDTAKLTEQRMHYMASAFGGPQSYSGKSMQEAHHSHNINDGNFNLFTYHLKSAFAEFNISQDLIEEAILILESARDEVLNKKPLFERIGGDKTLSKFEEMFTKKFLCDPVLGPVYGITDSVKIKDLYHQFMKLLFGGKTHYEGRMMKQAHSGHHINDSHFNRFIDLFRECFSELNVKEDLIQEAIGNLEKFRSEIVAKPSLFDRIGGYEVLHKILVRFNEKVLADQSMRPFFTNSDIAKLTEQRMHYMASAFGGPQSYTGKSMQEAHHSHNINDGNFNLFTYHLKSAFAEFNISQNLIEEAILILESARDEVLNRKPLFERIGGDNTLSKFEDTFTKKFLNDPVLGPVYGTTDPVKIKDLYHQFMKFLFGGKTHYEGRMMKQAHSGHHINDSHFNRFINLFRECFSELNVKEDLIQEAIANLEKFRSEIVTTPSLFDRIGGYEVLHKILVRFNEKVLADQSMRPFFTNSDTAKLTEQRMHYMASAFGGPQSYSGKSMQEAHYSHNINDGNFNLFIYHLKSAFAEFNISQNLIDEAILALEPSRNQVLNKKSLFERIGGDETLSKFQDLFIKRLLSDHALGPFYQKADPQKINNLYHQYFKLLFGGQVHYEGRPIREAHSIHHLDDNHFDRFIYLFKDCLSELKVKEDLIAEAITNLEKVRSHIVAKSSLFEKIGGFEGLEKALVRFNEKLLSDPTMSPYFANSDIQKLTEQRKHYMASIFGGPQSYSGRSMRDAHSNVKMNDQTFNLFLKHLYQAFLETGTNEELVREALEIVDLTRDKVLNRKSVFERLGGKDGLKAIIHRFHEELLLDHVLGPMYKKANPEKVIEGYTYYLTFLFGGLNEHEGRPLRVIHGSLKLTDAHFDIFVGTFKETLMKFKVDNETTQEIVMLFERRRNEILQRQPLWTRLGGEIFIDKALTHFEEKILADPVLKPMHQHIDLKRYHENHKDFFADIFGGYHFYSGKSLTEVHGPLHLKEEHYNVFVQLFLQTLTAMGVKEELIKEVLETFELKRNQVLNRSSLLERMGGEQMIGVIVEKLNNQLATDPVLGPMHKNVDWTKLHLLRKQFFTQLFGHLNVYTGRDIRTVHSDMKLNDEHFNLFLMHFKSAAEDINLSQGLIKEIMSTLETTRRDILNHPSLFEKLGGKDGVQKFVTKLDEKMAKDASMGHLFEKIDMAKFSQDQLQFFMTLFGGNAEEKKGMETAYEPIPLSDDHFKTFVEHTQDALTELGTEKSIVDEIIKVFQVKRNEVLGQ